MKETPTPRVSLAPFAAFASLFTLRNEFYVYSLRDPRNQRPFYVGKGHGRRVMEHARAARRGDYSNPRRTQTILEIWEAGHEVRYECESAHLTERQAFDRERELIQSLGLDRLTNIHPGRLSDEECNQALQARARAMLAGWEALDERWAALPDLPWEYRELTRRAKKLLEKIIVHAGVARGHSTITFTKDADGVFRCHSWDPAWGLPPQSPRRRG